MIVDLTKMKSGESGTVASLEGGGHFRQRVQNLGIRPGKTITKVSGHFWCGPITVQIGGSNVALGHGMAQKVMVEVQRDR